MPCGSVCRNHVCAALHADLPKPRFCCGGGSLQVTSTNGSTAEYHAVRIADEQALPVNEAFNWEALSGTQAPGLKPFPTYDAGAADAPAKGRALVERVSAELEHDGAGALAQWLTPYVRKDAPSFNVVTGGVPVPVDNGWYLLSSQGRRTLFAWVDGAPVTLGDKSDTPTLDKQVHNGDGWGDSAIGGSDAPFEYRVDVTIPTSYEAFECYELTIRDTHDAALALDGSSVRVELLRASASKPQDFKPVADLTGSMTLRVDGNAFSIAVGDLKKHGARPGDVVRATYRMSIDPQSVPGADGLRNDAVATFPSANGEGSTPSDATHVYGIKAYIHKVNSKGSALEGARFGVCNAAGAWLGKDGRFGSQDARAEFASNAQGMVEGIPVLAPGEYKLVELAAPKGYKLPANPQASFTVSAQTNGDGIMLSVTAGAGATVEDINGDDASFALQVVNTADGSTPGTGGTGGFMPQTGDIPWMIAAGTLVGAGVLLIAVGTRRRRSAKEDTADK